MKPIEAAHGKWIETRRARILAGHIAPLIPPDSRVLDFGSGDGRLGAILSDLRRDISISGVDVLIRPQRFISTLSFNGTDLPFDDGAFDVVLLIDVLHHAGDQKRVLSEALRVAKRKVVIKDHTVHGLFANATLRFMDRIGNARYGVELPCRYLRKAEWEALFTSLQLRVDSWSSNLQLYPIPLRWLFDRQLHFIASLGPDHE